MHYKFITINRTLQYKEGNIQNDNLYQLQFIDIDS